MNNEDGKKKVLYATFNSLPGPSGSACWSEQVLRELAHYFQVDALSLKTEDLSHIERLHQARLLRVPVGSGAFLQKVKAFQRALGRQLDSEEYDCCHFTSVWEGMLLCSRKKTDGYSLIYEVNSLPSIEFKTRYPAEARSVETTYSLKQQEERCFDVSDMVIAGSEAIRKHIIKRGVPPKKILTINPAVDITTFDPASEKPGQAGTILYLGSLQPWQGVIHLLQTLTEFPRNMRVRLLILAPEDDPNMSEVKGKVQILGLSKSVEFLSPVEFEDLAEIVSQASVCVAPMSSHERNRRAPSVPHKVLVYMASRRPIVASMQPSLTGILEHNQTAFLYAPGHSDGLLEALKKLLLDRNLASQLGNQARIYLEENLSLERSLKKIRGVYRTLLGEPRPRALPTQDDNTDTKPSQVSKKPKKNEKTLHDDTPVFRSASDTAKVNLYPDAEEVSDFLSDTQKEISSPDVVFFSIEDVDTSPRIMSDNDSWQVVAASEVNLSKLDTEPGKKTSLSADQKRFLLGGPTYQVEPELLEDPLTPVVPESQDHTIPAAPLLGAKESPKEATSKRLPPKDVPPPLPRKKKQKKDSKD